MVQRRCAKAPTLPGRAYKCLWSFPSSFETIMGCSKPKSTLIGASNVILVHALARGAARGVAAELGEIDNAR